MLRFDNELHVIKLIKLTSNKMVRIMTEKYDFEKAWLTKFSNCLNKSVGEEIKTEIMKGSEILSQDSNRKEIINWSKTALNKLDALVDESQRIDIMTGCACHYPREKLEIIRNEYEKTRKISIAHKMLQDQFESLLRDDLGLDKEVIKDIVDNGWGSAGIIRKNTIIATKIPKSGNLAEYFNEPDPERRRQLYCHCPRVRDVLKEAEKLSPTYCYCGAGFYKDIWETILQKSVKVTLLESVMKNDDVCKFAIYLS